MNADQQRRAETHPGGGRAERARKLIHIVASISAAVVALFAPAAAVAWLLLGAFLVAIAVEEARRHNEAAGRVFNRAFGGMLRPGEAQGITGATTLAAGFTIAALILPQNFAAAGILAGGLGDAAAALIGRRWGRFRLRSGKSLAGALACFAAALPAAWIIPGIDFPAAITTAVAAAIFEILPLPFDDNLWLPAATGVIAWASAVPLI